MQQFVNDWLSMSKDERLDLNKEQLKYFTDETFLKLLRKRILKDAKKAHRYLITFTINPSLNTDINAEELEDIIEQFVEAQAERSALGITYFAYSKEYTKAGRAHWHCVVVTTKPLPKNRFQYYTKTYGHVDISKTKVTTTLEALDYISKDVAPKVLIDK